jgi:hypothetical protein
VSVSENEEMLLERPIVLGPGHTGSVLLANLVELEEGRSYTITLKVRAETQNGTFAGSMEDIVTFSAQEREPSGNSLWEIALMIGSAIVLGLLGLVVYLGLSYRKMYKRDDRIDEIR